MGVPVAQAHPQTIVVVDDDEGVRALVEGLLREAGYAVVSTADPLRTVDLVRAERPDLVICDVAMSALDGYGVLRALQGDPEAAYCPVVFLSGQRDFSERVRAFRVGVVDYVTKPFTPEVLLKKVERALEGRHRRPGAAGQPARALLEAVQRDARTGVLTVRTENGEARVLLRSGQVVEGPTPSFIEDPSAQASFEELDAETADIVSAQDPVTLQGSADRLPSFEEFPPLVRDVLVVDDNAVFRRFLRDLLAAQGFTVREASDGEDGLRMALEHRPWLILTDVRMPGGDGFEFCRRVRSHSLIKQTPLLFLSGWDDYKQRYQGLRLGADDFLSKESSIRELLVRIQLLMKRYADLGARGAATGMSGEIHVIGAPGVLQVCHLSRLTGVLSAQDGPWRASVRFRDGEIVGAECGAAQGEDAVFEFLGWESGTFHFAAGDPGPGERVGATFDRVVLEGCRRLDEMRRAQTGGEP
jgi:DNA-binding response OmpR family regulator